MRVFFILALRLEICLFIKSLLTSTAQDGKTFCTILIDMTYRLFLFIFLAFGHLAYSQELRDSDVVTVTDFVNNIRNGLREKIAAKVQFPIYREYPIPPIANSAEFLKRFSEVFDKDFLNQIKNSKIPGDWSYMGSEKGIMFTNGMLWLSAGEDGGGLYGVNYQSLFEKNLLKSLTEKDRLTLHPSMRQYADPVCIVDTISYHIRVDELKDGTFRYASWKKTSKENSLPELQISSGTETFEGNLGDHSYIFVNKDFRYEIHIIAGGEEPCPPVMLIVYKADKEVFRQAGTVKGG